MSWSGPRHGLTGSSYHIPDIDNLRGIGWRPFESGLLQTQAAAALTLPGVMVLTLPAA